MARIGIDFGTTNSSVAYYDGRKLRPIELDAENENPHVLPSLIYIDRDFDILLGTQAANEYLQRETGRRIVWERKQIRPIEIIVAGSGSAPIRYWHDIHIETDVGANGRLLQSVKTALRDPGYEATMIFDRYYTIDDLIAIILRAMKARAEAQLGETCDSVVLGRPVRFAEDCIGPAAENGVLYAGIMNGQGRMSGRSGLGTVMGAKNLKAVAVQGHRSVPLADEAAFKKIARRTHEFLSEDPSTLVLNATGTSGNMDYFMLLGCTPVRYFTQGEFPASSALSGAVMAETILTGIVVSYNRASRGRSIRVRATTPPRLPSRSQISRCSTVCGITDSSAATTRSTTSMPLAPASMLCTNRS